MDDTAPWIVSAATQDTATICGLFVLVVPHGAVFLAVITAFLIRAPYPVLTVNHASGCTAVTPLNVNDTPALEPEWQVPFIAVYPYQPGVTDVLLSEHSLIDTGNVLGLDAGPDDIGMPHFLPDIQTSCFLQSQRPGAGTGYRFLPAHLVP